MIKATTPAFRFDWMGQKLDVIPDNNYLPMDIPHGSGGYDPRKRPEDFLNDISRTGLFREIERQYGVPVKEQYRVKGGRYFCHWQLWLQYAQHVNSRFAVAVGRMVQQWAEEEADPELKIERGRLGLVRQYEAQGYDTATAEAMADKRGRGKFIRSGWGDFMKGHGAVAEPRRNTYALATDAINTKVLGGPAYRLKQERKLPAKANLRDHLDAVELDALALAESAVVKVGEKRRVYGHDDLIDLNHEVGSKIGETLRQIGAL